MWTGAVWTTAQSHLSHHSTVDLWTISHGLVYRKLECGTEEGFWKGSSSLAAWSETFGDSREPGSRNREHQFLNSCSRHNACVDPGYR